MAKTKTKKAAPVEAPAPIELQRMPDEYLAELTLPKALFDNEIVNYSTLGDVHDEQQEKAEALVASWSDEERAAVLRFIRAVLWAAESGHGVTEADLTVPAVLAPFIAEDLASLEKMRRWVDDAQWIVETPAPSVDATGQLALVEGEETDADENKRVAGLDFQSADEAASVTAALESRAEDLEKEAKRLTDLKRGAEARALLREARHIREALLSQIAPQVRMPFNANESPLAAITRVVGSTVRTATVRAMKTVSTVGEGETMDEVLARREAELRDFERVVGLIAEHSAAAVMPVLREVAERAFEAGQSARLATPETLVREGVQAIAAQRMAA